MPSIQQKVIAFLAGGSQCEQYIQKWQWVTCPQIAAWDMQTSQRKTKLASATGAALEPSIIAQINDNIQNNPPQGAARSGMSHLNMAE